MSATYLASPEEHDSVERECRESGPVGHGFAGHDQVGYEVGGALLPNFAEEVSSCPMLRFLEGGMESSRRVRTSGGKGTALARLF